MKKINKQLIILLAAAVIVGSGLPNTPNPNKLNNPGENPISASDSEEKKDYEPDNNDGVNKPNCDDEEYPFSQ